MKVTTAVITAAGYGSRMLPVTSAVQKELLPLLDRPVIDYVVSDCLAAGITKFIFIIRPNSHGLQDYFIGNPLLESHLKRYGKDTAMAKLKAVHDQATYTFVEQPESAGYGSAVPLKLALPHLTKHEAFAVCAGDDFLWRTDGGSDFKGMVDAFTESGSDASIMTIEHPEDQLFKYGVLKVEKEGDREYLRDFIEKPEPGKAPSNLINLSKYILTPNLVRYIEAISLNPKHKEYLVTDGILAIAQKHKMLVHRAQGQYLDSGTVSNWLKANLTVAATRPDLANVMGKIHN